MITELLNVYWRVWNIDGTQTTMNKYIYDDCNIRKNTR